MVEPLSQEEIDALDRELDNVDQDPLTPVTLDAVHGTLPIVGKSIVVAGLERCRLYWRKAPHQMSALPLTLMMNGERVLQAQKPLLSAPIILHLSVVNDEVHLRVESDEAEGLPDGVTITPFSAMLSATETEDSISRPDEPGGGFAGRTNDPGSGFVGGAHVRTNDPGPGVMEIRFKLG